MTGLRRPRRTPSQVIPGDMYIPRCFEGNVFLPGDMYYPADRFQSYATEAALASVKQSGASNGLFMVAIGMEGDKRSSSGSAMVSNDGC